LRLIASGFGFTRRSIGLANCSWVAVLCIGKDPASIRRNASHGRSSRFLLREGKTRGKDAAVTMVEVTLGPSRSSFSWLISQRRLAFDPESLDRIHRLVSHV